MMTDKAEPATAGSAAAALRVFMERDDSARRWDGNPPKPLFVAIQMHFSSPQLVSTRLTSLARVN